MSRRDPAGDRSPINHTVVAGTKGIVLGGASSLIKREPDYDASHSHLLELVLVNRRITETTILVGGSAYDPQARTSDEFDLFESSTEGEVSEAGNYVLASPSPPIHEDGNASDQAEVMSFELPIPNPAGVAIHLSDSPRSSVLLRPIPRRQRPITLSQGRNTETPAVQRIRFLEPDIPRYDSPVQEDAEVPFAREVIESEHLDNICHSILEVEKALPGSDGIANSSASHDGSTITDVSRKILIIGSNYNRRARRTYTVSSAITLESPSSDKERLRFSFGQRGYSVHSMVNDTFDRDAALERVSSFLSTARCRDVRAIVFTGHAVRAEGSRPALIPPDCPDPDQAIPAELWERTIRESTQPGVIVLSIFASCFSGGFMQQPIDLQNLNTETSNTSSVLTPNPGPILVTFTSSSEIQRSYESSIETHDPWRVADHFLHALDMTARRPNVRDWRCFISAMQEDFQRAREIGAASFEEAGAGEVWLRNSPQTPAFTASDMVDLPTLFPDFRNE
ncbi:hypothetical protein FRC07_000499 [Ceratobasidium sp. 392]|nr:hypothetical protein FRC07_000499 [Ceratobasidium sp. 392]